MQEARDQNDEGLWKLHEHVMAQLVDRLTHRTSSFPLPSILDPSPGVSSADEKLEGSE